MRNVRSAVLALSFALVGACTDSGRSLDEPSRDVLNAAPGSGSPTDTTSAGSTSDSVPTLLSDFAEVIAKPNYQNLVTVSTSFAAEDGPLSAYCSAIDSGTENLASLRPAWMELVAAVQKTEMHALGPAAQNAAFLRNRISSYEAGPLSQCGTDGIAVLHTNTDFDLGTRSANQRGLSALDYLLFNEDLDHSCPPQATVTQGWNERPVAERKALRCGAAIELAADMAIAAQEIHDAWSETGANFVADFTSASSQGEQLQALTDAMFFIEEGAKDAKLGNPLGIVAACSAVSCPNLIELPHSEDSLEAIRINLEEFLRIFTMADGTGFDTLITERGFPEVAQRFIDNTQRAIDFADGIDMTLSEQVSMLDGGTVTAACTNAVANPDVASEELPTCTLYGLVKRVVDDLKLDFVTIVNVNLPGGTRADND